MKASIGNKIFTSFIALIVIVFLALTLFSIILFKKHNSQFIQIDLDRTRDEVNFYLELFITSKQLSMYNTVFDMKDELLADLNKKLGARGAIYELDGKLISGDESSFLPIRNNKKDLRNALNKKDSYTIFRKEKLASLSVLLKIKGEVVAVYRLERDYSSIYDTSNRVTRIIIIFGVFSILFVLLISYKLSRSITRPIIMLKEYSNRIAGKDYDIKFEIQSNDEVGDLAKNFVIMQNKIKEHIQSIEKDKVLLNELLEQRKRFFDSVTHELKTPLTVIQGYTQMLAHNGFHDEDFFNKGTTHILEESIRLHKMVLSLLELSEQNTINVNINFEFIDVSEVLEKVCESMIIKAKGNDMFIETDIQPGIVINACRDDIRGLFINIIDNSIKYAGQKAIINVKALDRGDNVEIIIKDNGIGIFKDKLERIFEPFYRIDNRKSRELGGSGLGLAIAKKIVENHHGEINIDSSENNGVIVTIVLYKSRK